MNTSPVSRLSRQSLERASAWTDPREYRLEWVDFDETNGDAAIRATWDRLSSECAHPNAFHASRAWAGYVNARGAPVRVLVVRDAAAEVVGVVPVVRHRHGLDYEIGGRALRDTFRVVDVLGSVPLTPNDAALPARVAQSVFDAFPDCEAVFFESLPEESEYVELGGPSASGLLGYEPSRFDPGHLIHLRGSFDEYFRSLSPKTRSNTERALRALGGASAAGLILERSRTPEEVSRLFTAAAHVRRRSWQHGTLGDLNDDALQSSRDGLSELARRGLLRSYVLHAHGAPCAFVIGYQSQGVYFYGVVGYDEAFARSSPGTALLYLLLEDLFERDRPRFLSFGRGDDDYKRRFGTRQMRVGTRLLFRPTLRNRIRIANHRLFRRASAILAGKAQIFSQEGGKIRMFF